MKNLKPLLLAFAFLCLARSASAQILIVSDIDDTLKASHVLSLRESVLNVLATENHFLGMSDLFHSVDTNEKVTFAYVSNAPEPVMESMHKSFLSQNQFPVGDLFLKPPVFGADHKLRIIRALIRNIKPRFVVLIGDNGEADPLIYSEIRNTFSQLPIKTFIHQVYSVKGKVEKGQPLQLGQMGYATSVDLAVQFRSMNLVSQASFEKLVATVVPKMLAEKNDLVSGEMAFPKWMDCRDFLSQTPRQTDTLLAEYDKKIQTRCSQGL